MDHTRSCAESKSHPIDLNQLRPRVHPSCFVCSSANADGLNLEFQETGDGAVEAWFDCKKQFEGYSGCVHGGIISSVLDGAMTNCLFAQGFTPLTAELSVRFHHPLLIGKPAVVSAWIEHRNRRLYFLRARITQENLVKAHAWAKFLDNRSDLGSSI